MLLVAAVALVALSACGSADARPPAKDDAPQVATLATAEPERTGSAEPKKERPRQRLDTTSEEFLAMLGPYNACMAEQGIPGKNGSAPRPTSEAEMETFEAANRVCEPQFYPLPPWEKDPANPEARDFALDVMKCLKAQGVRYVEVDEDGISLAFGGDQNDSRSISMGLDLAPECERKVAAEFK
ncbi:MULTISPECIES: hypothetical protein [Micromonospora]|uniref:Lipoprotein n=1 Tax=Micromonospora yangpuensis TaxID=683228 RepID=A0A1C6VGR7_9ACTN|nr:hypothetical protein [Micromonospora yangpuensis]GGL99167.1 hypothetical protein GCM10012279_15720 [Micromonospora yangpuensis]SCL65519.1 hypothetical protein GA0070617_5789 [Micromonospora yangpuensis]